MDQGDGLTPILAGILMLNLLLIFGLGRSPYSSNTLRLPLCSPSIIFCQTGKRKGNLHLCPNSSTPPSRGRACLWVLCLCLEDKGEGFELSLYLLKPTPLNIIITVAFSLKLPSALVPEKSSPRWACIITEDRHLFQMGRLFYWWR